MVIKNHYTGKRADMFNIVCESSTETEAAGPLALLSMATSVNTFGIALVAPEQDQHLQSDAEVRFRTEDRSG